MRTFKALTSILLILFSMVMETRAQRPTFRLMQLAVILRPYHLTGSDEQHRAALVVLRKIFGVVPSGESAYPR